MKIFRVLAFWMLRLYVAIEQSRLVRWLAGKEPEAILETMPRADDDVPMVHEKPSIFLASDGRAAYVHHGATLRRVAVDETGTLVHIRKPGKAERKALKRANNRYGNRRVSDGA